ncbi:MAG TPA: FecR family protein [Chitinophagaceae bacterium]
MIADRFWELLAKQAFAEANESELREFEDFLSDHPDYKNIAESLTGLSHQSLLSDQDHEAEKVFEQHVHRIRNLGIEFHDAQISNSEPGAELKTNGVGKRLKRWSVFAGCATIVVLTILIFRNNVFSSAHVTKSKVLVSQVTTKPASRTQIQLPDGSSVWLNSSSNLTYDKDFGKDLREVNLTGEGFFDVVKDPSHPFIIHTKVIDVKVLGTEFNVKAYPNDAYTETSLIRGSVEITVKNRPEEKHYLKPNEKMSVANDILNEEVKKTTKSQPFILTQPLTYYPIDSTIVETSWVNNRLIFQENETFREVALKMERWYGVRINFAYMGAADEYRPFVSFQNETINQALDELKEGYKFNYKMDGPNVTITQ